MKRRMKDGCAKTGGRERGREKREEEVLQTSKRRRKEARVQKGEGAV